MLLTTTFLFSKGNNVLGLSYDTGGTYTFISLNYSRYLDSNRFIIDLKVHPSLMLQGGVRWNIIRKNSSPFLGTNFAYIKHKDGLPAKDKTKIKIHLELGYTFCIKQRVNLTPYYAFGYFLENKAELDSFVFEPQDWAGQFGLSLGYRF